MNYTEFASKIKQKYPQYKDMDDRDLSQRMVKKYPQYSDVTFDEPKTDWKGSIRSAISELTMRPGTQMRSMAKDVLTNPETQANMMPGLMGTVGGLSPLPGGSTLGTGLGQALRYGARKVLKKPQPSGLQIGGELGLSALGDIAAIPAMKKAYYGGKIGQAERTAGVPLAQNIPSLPMATGTKTTGEFINDAVESVKATGGKAPASFWLQIKDQVDRLYRMGKDQALTTLDKGRLKWLSSEVQSGLNAAVPGRGAPAAALAKSQAIPRAIGQVYKAIPGQFKRGAAYGAGAGAAGLTVYDLLKKLIGG